MPLTTFAAAVAVAVSLMFVTVLLAAGALALEREQNTFTRLVRGPVSRTALLAEKVVVRGRRLGAADPADAAGRVRVRPGGVGPVPPLAARRGGRGAAAFAAMGTLVGALAREVQTASLLAFTLLLPVAFLALVPVGRR